MLPLSSKIGPGLISSFLSKRWLIVVLDGMSSQEYPVNAGVPEGSILGPTLFLLYMNELPGNTVILLSILMMVLGKFPPGQFPPVKLSSCKLPNP